MNPEMKALVWMACFLTTLGLVAMTLIMIYRPQTNAIELGVMAGVITQIILAVVSVIKGFQNSADIKANAEHQQEIGKNVKEMKVSVDGNIKNLVEQSTAVASLTEQLAATKSAAEVAAQTAANTAEALAKKIDSNTIIVKEKEG